MGHEQADTIHIKGVPEVAERERKAKSLFGEIMAKNSPNMEKMDKNFK